MELDTRTTLIIQISAAVATNALASLRASVTDAKALGISSDEIRQIVKIAQEVQEQPLSHTRHLLDQLLREPIRKSQEHTHDHEHIHGPNCNCGHHS
ncbi:hypothetical protein [Desulfitobacterium metallireducens]|uniref:Carboxymuconolactone decarboxylase n=1 Tax=Desulfitobacterium metallireducens DSM 15288 TaxID=871968 RepID=W0EE06_9FIRM|nr:hypothetical protein [Desulfitobacterium metallireducens]AHF07296.1 hypothetical protein DESME_09860 [Desulfitobacterium metallireducens DSM 15288]